MCWIFTHKCRCKNPRCGLEYESDSGPWCTNVNDVRPSKDCPTAGVEIAVDQDCENCKQSMQRHFCKKCPFCYHVSADGCERCAAVESSEAFTDCPSYEACCRYWRIIETRIVEERDTPWEEWADDMKNKGKDPKCANETENENGFAGCVVSSSERDDESREEEDRYEVALKKYARTYLTVDNAEYEDREPEGYPTS